MSSALRSPTFAHVAPLAVFLGFTGLVPLLSVENTMLPWWRHAPEQWIYPLQTIVVGVLLWLGRRHYNFAPFRGFAIAIVFGIVGILWWCAPALLWQRVSVTGVSVPFWCEWLGVAPRKEGFDPTLFREHAFGYGLALFMRFVRMIVIVPFSEEIFWRAFLMRYVQAGGSGSFRRVPFGQHSWPAFLVSTLGFVIVHDHMDWVGALGFGALMYLLTIRAKSLAACVLMHAAANLLLGVYVVATWQWGFW